MIQRIKKALFGRRKQPLSAKANADKVKSLNSAYFRCFNTPDGQKVLEDMIERYYAIPIAQQGDQPMDVGEKQGKANVVSDIIARMTANQ